MSELTNDTMIDLQLTFGEWEDIHTILQIWLDNHLEKESEFHSDGEKLKHKINRYLEFASRELF